ncbi:hypothetical protein HQ41_01410 [Porphyromonas sp. COT-290 OH860]|nr:hypothetical protein HQ41_01410 [Porphyromonas sp. COT-290 OH860]
MWEHSFSMIGTIITLTLVLSLVSCSIRPYQGPDDILYTGVKDITFAGGERNEHTEIAKAAAEERFNYAPNNSIFGSASYRWPLPLVGPWIHLNYASDSTWLGRWAHRAFGSKPIWIRDVNPALRSRVTERVLAEFGYLNAQVTHEIHPNKSDSLEAKISYHVNFGSLYRIDTMEYLPTFTLKDSLKLVHREQSVLKPGRLFTHDVLHNDRIEVSSKLREYGYYYFRPEYIQYEADTMNRSDATVHLRSRLIDGVNPEALKPWRIRNINLRFLDNDDRSQNLLADTVHINSNILAYYNGRLPLRLKILDSRLRMRPDSLFKQSKADLTLKSLSNLGTFSGIELLYNPVEVDNPSEHTERQLDLSIMMRQDRLWEVSLEALFKLKSTEFVGPGLRFVLDRKNLFGGGEVLSTAIYGSYEWQTDRSPISNFSSTLNSYQIGAEAALTFPTLLFPGQLDRFYRYPANTTFKLSGQKLNRAHFYGLSSFGLSYNYDFTPQEGHSHSITPLSISYNQLSDITDSFAEILRNNPSLILSMQDQLVPQMGYTYTWEQAVGRSRSHQLWVRSGISQAGNIINATSMLLGHEYNKTKQLLGLPYAQFIKGTSELRYTYKIDRNQKLATRLFLGAVYAYGNVKQAPYLEQFYIGGANSLRAFTVRSLGPGRYKPKEGTIYTFIDRVGETKLEMNMEYRGRLVGNLEGAVFVDAGNVWLLRPDPDKPGSSLGEIENFSQWLDQIAVGTGVGLRYDLNYLVIRCDVGLGLHLPYQTERKGWYNIPRLGDALGIHLAIGYPF